MARHPPELRAQVVAEWTLGASLGELSRKHGLAKSTVQEWTSVRHERTAPIRVPENQPDELGELIYECFRALLLATTAHARAAASPEFAQQLDEHWHARFGTLADKVLLLGGAIQRGQAEPIELPGG